MFLIKSVTYSSQERHTDQLDFCNWLANGSKLSSSIIFPQTFRDPTLD